MAANFSAPSDLHCQTPLIASLKIVSCASGYFSQLLVNKVYKNKVELALAISKEYRRFFQQEPPTALVQGIVLWNRDSSQVVKGRGISDQQLNDIVSSSIF